MDMSPISPRPVGLDQIGALVDRSAARLDLGHVRSFVQQGHLAVADLWDDALGQRLADEALALAPVGDDIRREVGAPPQATAEDAPLLTSRQFSLIPLVRALTGRLLVPSLGWYNYYTGDDGIWLHVDIRGSEVAVLAGVHGEVGPLHLHPELEGLSQPELDAVRRDPRWDELSGCVVGYPRNGVLVHRGRAVPHHRPRRPLATPSVVAALHYATLL